MLSFELSDTTTLVWTVVGSLVIWRLVSAFSSWYLLRHVPGPRLASISHLWLIRNNLLGISHEKLVGLKKYGSLVRVGPNYVLTHDPDTLRRISSARNAYARADWWQAVRYDPKRDNMVSTTDTVWHDRIKAQVMSAYNGRDYVDLDGGIDSQITILVDMIRRRYLSSRQETRPAELGVLMRYYTLDVISRLAYGEQFGFLQAKDDLYGYLNSADYFAKFVGLFLDTPILRGLITSPLGHFMMPKATDEKGLGRLLRIGQEHIRKSYENKSTHQTGMIASYIRHGLTREESEAECVVPLLAASDTTPTALRSTLLHLLGTARVYNKLKAEIKNAIGSGLVSATSPITNEQAKKMPYLQAVIYEGLRIRSPALYGHFKSVPPEGATLNGIFLPGGTAIGHNSAALMRSEEIFGKDVDIFRPERFLECDDSRRVEMERAIELVFGTGRWICAGKAIAFMQLNKTYFELLRTFDFQLINPGKPWTEQSTLVWLHKDLYVRITEGGADDEGEKGMN